MNAVDIDTSSSPLSFTFPVSEQTEVGAPHLAKHYLPLPAITAGAHGWKSPAVLGARCFTISGGAARLVQHVPPQALPLPGHSGILRAGAAFGGWWCSEVALQIKDLQFVPLFRPCHKAPGTKTKPRMKNSLNEAGGASGSLCDSGSVKVRAAGWVSLIS